MDFPFARDIRKRLQTYLSWVRDAVPSLSSSRFRKPVDLYGLLGALDRIYERAGNLADLEPEQAGRRLVTFERSLEPEPKRGDPSRYWLAASRQTDNIAPRSVRIAVLEKVLLSGS